MNPIPGKLYILAPPFGAIEVESVDAKWVHIRTAPDKEDEGVPQRIKLRNWAEKRPEELTSRLRQGLMKAAREIREMDAQAGPLPHVERP